MRAEISILSEIERNKDSKKKKKKRRAGKVIKKHKITSANDIPGIKEELKQKMQLKKYRGI